MTTRQGDSNPGWHRVIIKRDIQHRFIQHTRETTHTLCHALSPQNMLLQLLFGCSCSVSFVPRAAQAREAGAGSMTALQFTLPDWEPTWDMAQSTIIMRKYYRVGTG